MLNLLWPFLTSLILAAWSIPSIVYVANLKLLYDQPDEFRKRHQKAVPTLGGMAIFASMILSMTFWSNQKEIFELQYIICSIIMIFFIGIRDDVVNVPAIKKLLGQLVASVILVHFAGIRLTTMYGLFGVNDLSIGLSYLLSVFSIVVITNSFNLIDGIDGLAGTVATISSVMFGTWFYLYGESQYAILSAAMTGSLIGFLIYNRSPAKIFMGDGGSLIVGMVNAIFAIKFIELNRVLPLTHELKVLSVPVVTIAILIIPLFDTLRVFTIRLLERRSPFSADRNHIHHLIVDMGFSHMQATGILASFNLLMIGVVWMFHGLRGEFLLFVVLSIALAFSIIAKHFSSKRNKVKNVKILESNGHI